MAGRSCSDSQARRSQHLPERHRVEPGPGVGAAQPDRADHADELVARRALRHVRAHVRTNALGPVCRPSGREPTEQDARRVPFAPTRFNEEDGRFSPDGEWVAYVSNESGANEVYIRKFNRALTNGLASVGTSVVVSKGGGSSPRWRRDGKELFYLAPGGKMMSVAVALDPNSARRHRSRCFKGRPMSRSAT